MISRPILDHQNFHLQSGFRYKHLQSLSHDSMSHDSRVHLGIRTDGPQQWFSKSGVRTSSIALSRNLKEMKILGPNLNFIESKTLEVGHRNHCDYDALLSFRTIGFQVSTSSQILMSLPAGPRQSCLAIGFCHRGKAVKDHCLKQVIIIRVFFMWPCLCTSRPLLSELSTLPTSRNVSLSF